MGFKIKDIVAIALVTFISVPIVYFLMLFLTGNARLEFSGGEDGNQRKESVKTMASTPRVDSLVASHSKAFVALQQEREMLHSERERLGEETGRVTMSRRELENERTRLESERQRLENLVQQVDSLDQKHIKQLAKVYESMRPVEAAQILETQSTGLVIRIFRSMGDDRQKAKIMAALPKDKAATITKIMGKTQG